MTERLYFQYRPDAGSSRSLERLQRAALAAYGGIPVPPAQFHMTFLHIGIVERFVHNVAVGAANGTPEQADIIASNLRAMTERIGTVMPSELDIVLSGFRRFGRDHSVLVALADVPAGYAERQQEAVEALKDCIAFCGIPAPEAFIAASPELSAALDHDPHISLLWGAGYAPVIPEVQESLHLEAVPSNYDLKHGRYT